MSSTIILDRVPQPQYHSLLQKHRQDDWCDQSRQDDVSHVDVCNRARPLVQTPPLQEPIQSHCSREHQRVAKVCCPHPHRLPSTLARLKFIDNRCSPGWHDVTFDLAAEVKGNVAGRSIMPSATTMVATRKTAPFLPNGRAMIPGYINDSTI
ncbi:hypothetical protein CPB85DRAFT_594906 [Mucidula mucida]|nr:hypothetical protein CPB85DRAFT_594906 [Mucidula mucida]